MMPAVGMLLPLLDVLLVMGAEAVTIFCAEMILPAAMVIILVIAIVRAPVSILLSASVFSGSVLRRNHASEGGQSRPNQAINVSLGILMSIGYGRQMLSCVRSLPIRIVNESTLVTRREFRYHSSIDHYMDRVREGYSCAVCDRLRREYESALLALLRAESQLQIAGFARDFNATKTLEREVEALAVRRRALQAKLLDHEVSAHNGSQQVSATPG
jgi:hypothetical protein